jgi:hypothetical protein
MATMSITSNDGALASASAVLEVSATNPAYNQPAFILKTPCVVHRIDQPSPNFGRSAKRSSLPGVIILRQPDR